jgi:hypothetical protein
MDGSVDLTEYQLIFAEEFADFIPYEPSTKSGVWTTRYYWGPETVINKELQYYIDITSDQRKAVNPFRVEKGSLVIEGKPANPEDVHGFNNQRYTSGAITTKDSFSTTYGYFEIRAQMPAGKGLWPAFWLMPADKSPTPELDIMEMTGDRPNELVTKPPLSGRWPPEILADLHRGAGYVQGLSHIRRELDARHRDLVLRRQAGGTRRHTTGNA